MIAAGSIKDLARAGYCAALGAATVLNAPFVGGKGAPRVFYGGARAGDVGGPLVKIKRLSAHFPEVRVAYNLVYALSNAPYLPDLALAVLRRRAVPIVHNQNGIFYAAWYKGDWQAQNARMARTYHQAAYVFWQSAFCRRSADVFLGERSGPGEVLYNAVDTARFSPQPRQADAKTVFLATGKIDAHLFYRLESTIEALALVCADGLDAELRISGWVAPEAQARAAALAAQRGLGRRVVFTGAYSQAQAPDIYRAADIYVTTKHNDPCPNAVIEALACGLPVVYANSGGVSELVGAAGCGVDVRPGFEALHTPAADAVAAAMKSVASVRAALAAVARTRAVERFDITHWIERHRAVFAELTR
jgi:glycosyltransferase involved in cell wall biosynthesis